MSSPRRRASCARAADHYSSAAKPRRSALPPVIGYTLCHNSSRRKDTPMREAVVVASSRTPLAKSHRGSFNLARPDDLAAHAIRDVLGKAPQVQPKEIEEV